MQEFESRGPAAGRARAPARETPELRLLRAVERHRRRRARVGRGVRALGPVAVLVRLEWIGAAGTSYAFPGY